MKTFNSEFSIIEVWFTDQNSKPLEFKTASKREIQKNRWRTGNMIGNKIANKITKVSRISTQNSLDAVKSKAENIGFDREIPKERNIFPEKNSKLLMI